MGTTRGARLGGSLVAATLCMAVGGCATTGGPEDRDPAEGLNRAFYQVNEGLDKVLKPVAQVYADITPQPVRSSITNFFDNASSLDTILNNFLQGKGQDGFASFGRFLVNTTFGLGGLFDPATKMGLKRRTEDLGQTLGHYGAGEGAYLVLPLFGPTSVRDAPGIGVGAVLSPWFWFSGTVLWPVSAVNAINTRANLLEATRVRDEAALDPYVFTREAWRQRREFDVYDGNPPPSGLDDFMLEDSEAEAEPSAGGGAGGESAQLRIE